MLSMLQAWKGRVEVNGKVFDNIHVITPDIVQENAFCIKLLPKTETLVNNGGRAVITENETVYKITVKQYMTKEASPEFDFMAKWNNNVPMPLRTMTGTVVKQTRGMVYMKLHGVGEPVVTCMRCGKTLTNPISRHYGIGPECMCKLGIVADIDDVDNIKKQLVDVTWEGWIIKSAITKQEEI